MNMNKVMLKKRKNKRKNGNFYETYLQLSYKFESIASFSFILVIKQIYML